jgi:hypothetical protein
VLGVLFLCVTACGPNHRQGDDMKTDSNTAPVYDAPTCATLNVKADKVPLDLYIMLDQSASMMLPVSGGNRWSAVTAALDAFVVQPSLSGVSVGLQYFGVPGAGGGSAVDSCTASDYATPEVEVAALPDVATTIIASIAGHTPSTATPTSAALQGAVDHAEAWAQAHPGDAVVAVLATDGDPSECDTDLGHINAIAAQAANGTPKVLTFVIGVGSSLANLNGIAAAGGTQHAFLVDTGGNVNQQFLDAMNVIRHAALGCEYAIPTPTGGGTPDYGTVNVVYTPSGQSSQTFPYVMSKAQCPANSDGWYYDNPASPTKIILCDSTCTRLESDSTGEVDITLGCQTVIL